jgi:hypothetical protein
MSANLSRGTLFAIRRHLLNVLPWLDQLDTNQCVGVTVSEVNIRPNGSTDFDPIGQLGAETPVVIMGYTTNDDEETWYRINIGWVRSDFVTLSDEGCSELLFLPNETIEQVPLSGTAVMLIYDQEPTDDELAYWSSLLGNGILSGTWTVSDLRRAVGIIEELQAYNISLEPSDYRPTSWSLGELEALQESVREMANRLYIEFKRILSTNPSTAKTFVAELFRLARELGVPPENVPFVLLFNNLVFRRDLGGADGSVHYNLQDGCVDAEGNPLCVDANGNAVACCYDANGNLIDPGEGDVRYDANGNPIMLPGRWDARAGDSGLTFGPNVFDESASTRINQPSTSNTLVEYTAAQLITHEAVHRLVGSVITMGIDFSSGEGVTLLVDFYASLVTGEHDGVDFGQDWGIAINRGFTIAPRTTNDEPGVGNDQEVPVDAITNWIWGSFSSDAFGQVRERQLDVIMNIIITAVWEQSTR